MVAVYFDPIGRRWVQYDPVTHEMTYVYGPPTGFPAVTVVKVRRSTNHGLHLALTLITLGLWLPVWLLVWLTNRFGPRERSVIRERVG